ncbi:MAG TPA: hypothetical protein VMR50_11205 [Myxococcota bacterium]|nr:hypothetical protein [Myxococcota bacterium]
MTRVAAVLAAALLCLACAAPIRSELMTPDPPRGLTKIALLPLQTDPMGPDVSKVAVNFVTARIQDALQSETHLRVVDPDKADALLSGTVRRYLERDGTSSGVRRPASVWIVLELRDAAGQSLWTGTYEETQPALSDDVGSLPRAWERGFRWVTADDLAAYGVRELVRALGREVDTWS